MEIVCPFLTDQKTCQHIDEAIGEPVAVDPRACQCCIENHIDPSTRHSSYPVLNLICRERRKRGVETGPAPILPRKPTMQAAQRDHAPRPNIADEMLAAARTVPRRTPAPVVSEPEARLAICEDCSSWINERCKAACGTCANRPRPMAAKGRDCPQSKWRRG